MRAKSSNENPYSASHVRGGQDALAVKVIVDRALTRTCCGQLIEPQLAEARDRSGNLFFAAVWYCPGCGRMAF